MSGPLSLRFSTQAMADVRRITGELGRLQAQMASGAKASDLQGFGGASSRLLSAQSLKSNADAKSSVISQLQARFAVQGAALGQVADAAGAFGHQWACRGVRWHRGQRNDDRFMKCSRTTSAPQRSHGSPVRP